MRFIEDELYRQALYQTMITDLIAFMKQSGWEKIKYKTVVHMILRQIFIRIIVQTEEDDPVFIKTTFIEADQQMIKDLLYESRNGDHKIIHVNKNEEELSNSAKQVLKRFLIYLESYAQKMSKFKALTNIRDRYILFPLRNQRNIVSYKNIHYEDHSQLITKSTSEIQKHKALAIHIRYTYLNLLNQGLARRFEVDLKLTRQDAVEGFSSLINHYFDVFFTAFPDLEGEFGSRGSFFQADLCDPQLPHRLFVNPPFDELVMLKAAQKVIQALESGSTHEFIFTYPNWTNFEALNLLRTSNWKKKDKVYAKGELAFMDYMKAGCIIYPCNIAEIVLSRTKTIE